MTATQAPTPGPLDSESVKLLVKGDWLRVVRKCEDGPEAGSPVTFERADGSRIWINDDPDSWWFDRFTFIGRPDESGWMPWSGGENPVPGKWCEWFFEHTGPYAGLSSDALWDRVARFRLAPTAPVEASGQRIIDGLKQAASGDYETRAVKVEASGSEQESGDYTMALAEVQPFEDYPELAAHIERMATTGRIGSMIEWDGFLSQLNATISTLLSAGGQHSGGKFNVEEYVADYEFRADEGSYSPNENERALLIDAIHGALSEAALSTTPARAEAQDEDTPCTDCGDTGVTHQTERRCSCQEGEAQDEGAAGKWPEVTDQWAETYCDLTGQNPDGAQVSFIGDGAVTTTFRDKAKRQIEAMLCAAPKAAVRAISAHPSPTPAADADRVRIAVEALEEIEHLIKISPDVPSDDFDRGGRAARFQAFDIASPALAALKSTAAKEGGE